MSAYRRPMPSFTLVLTSGHPSVRSSTIQLSPAGAMLPTAPDSLMKTIDLRYHSTHDEFAEDDEKDIDSQTIFAAEKLATFDRVGETEQTNVNPIKRNLLVFIRKLVTYTRKVATYKNGPIGLL